MPSSGGGPANEWAERMSLLEAWSHRVSTADDTLTQSPVATLLLAPLLVGMASENEFRA